MSAIQRFIAATCRGLLAGLILCGLVAPGHAAAQLARVVQFDVPSQPLEAALRQVAAANNLQILYTPGDVRNRTTNGVKGSYTIKEAVDRLLQGTGLVAVASGPNSIVIRPEGEGGRKGSGADGGPLAASAASLPSATVPQEKITVTAQKRFEILEDVPVPVTALQADRLLGANQLRIQDFYTSVPGLNVAPTAQAAQIISIRGVTTGVGNPTVGITVDDVPYGASTNMGGGLAVPDIDPGDLARVEVLRGPQGTLYGANSLGGLLKFVTIDPATDRFSARGQAGLSDVHNGTEVGYNLRGSANIPLGNELALRVSGFTRLDPGYIENVQTGERGVNEERVTGGRVSALWRPSSEFALKLSALFQENRLDGSSEVDKLPGLGDLQQSYIPGAGSFVRKVQAYSAIATAMLGAIELTSATGYSVNSFKGSSDFTYAFGELSNAFFGVDGSTVTDDNRVTKFTQELRLYEAGKAFDWLLGGFYTRERTAWVEDIFANDLATGAPVAKWGTIDFPSTYDELAIFANLTWHVADRFDIQVGGRQSRIKQTSNETDSGEAYNSLFGLPAVVVLPEVEAKSNPFTYLVTPRFKLSPDAMLYARLASGYRTGGTNAAPGVPRQYDPDKTQNYEVGFKGVLPRHGLSVDASLYLIDWKDVQLSLLDPASFQLYKANGSRARSKGAEIAVEARPAPGLTLAGWVAWNDAELTEAFPAGSTVKGQPGDRLPFSSRVSGTLSLQQAFSLGGAWAGFAGAAASYVGERKGPFTGGTGERETYPAYTKVDLNAGVRWETYVLNFFVNNVADKRGVLAGGLGSFPAYAFTYIQPRTVGVSLVRKF